MPGPGFEQAGDQTGRGGTASRTFVHPAGQLVVQYTPLAEDMDAAQFFAFMEQADPGFPGLVRVDVPGLPLARWSATEGVDAGPGPGGGRHVRQPHRDLHRAAEQ